MINNLCSRLMLYGFLEELHVFSRTEVERVAEDLRQERSFDALAQKPTSPQLTSVSSPDTSPQDISARLTELDRRIEVQENFMHRLAAALHLSYSGRSKNSRSA